MITKRYYKLIRVNYSDSEYFHITNLTTDVGSFSFVKNGNANTPTSFEYSTDGVTWNTYDLTERPTVSVPAKGNIYFRAVSGGNSYSDVNYNNFHFDKQYKIGGNIVSVINYNNMNSLTTLGGASSGKSCLGFFKDETNLVSSSELSFGVVTMADIAAFKYMFSGCSSMIDTPYFTGITDGGGNYAFGYCFQNCTSLNTGVDLSGFTNFNGVEMYNGCSNLNSVVAPNVSTWSTSYMSNWLVNAGTNVSGTKIVSCPTGVTIPTNSTSGIPNGWTRTDY